MPIRKFMVNKINNVNDGECYSRSFLLNIQPAVCEITFLKKVNSKNTSCKNSTLYHRPIIFINTKKKALTQGRAQKF